MRGLSELPLQQNNMDYSDRDSDMDAALAALSAELEQKGRLDWQELICTLLDLKPCARCVLRFLGVRNFKLYAHKDTFLRRILAALLQSKPESTQVNIDDDSCPPECSLCLGVVQHADTPRYVEPVVEKLKHECYDDKTFNLNATLPTSTLVRTHSASVYLRKRFAEKDITGFAQICVTDVKEVFKLLLCWEIERILTLKLDFVSPLTVSVIYAHNSTADDHLFLTRVESANFTVKRFVKKGQQHQTGDSRSNIKAALEATSDEDFIREAKFPPSHITEGCTLSGVETSRSPVYVGGRYLKLTRDVSQTPFIIGGVRKGATSVSECIGDVVVKHYKADSCTMVAAGREDLDVRMLNEGRPFYLEIINPRKSDLPEEDVMRMQLEINSINDKVKVRKLCRIDEKSTAIIKEGEESKTKSYRALVWVSKIIDESMLESFKSYEKGFSIAQGTPLRVLHRRTQMIRNKQIHSLSVERIDDHFMVLRLKTEAGTYIKEFVHGDLGRTSPSFGNLAGCDADIFELDVEEVDLPWPPVKNS